ncbi:hypothetical protein LJ601_002175 [Acinetobacter baumannii]|nr:hypothetical protein [Acinetobacter baumannii]
MQRVIIWTFAILSLVAFVLLLIKAFKNPKEKQYFVACGFAIVLGALCAGIMLVGYVDSQDKRELNFPKKTGE